MTAIFLLALTFAIQDPASPAQIQGWYEAGDDQQVVAAAEGRNEPLVVYLAGMAHARQERPVRARETFERLASRGEGNAWSYIGRSAVLLNSPPSPETNTQAAVAAQRAVEIDPDLAMAHYQLGLAQGRQDNYEGAAASFERAAQLAPRFAYAHYYGGLASYRIKRTTKMAEAFENFLTVAPSAPERGQVGSTMRTLRGR